MMQKRGQSPTPTYDETREKLGVWCDDGPDPEDDGPHPSPPAPPNADGPRDPETLALLDELDRRVAECPEPWVADLVAFALRVGERGGVQGYADRVPAGAGTRKGGIKGGATTKERRTANPLAVDNLVKVALRAYRQQATPPTGRALARALAEDTHLPFETVRSSLKRQKLS